MKKLITLFGLLLITKLSFSQISVGVDYINNNNASRKYSKSLSGFDINLKYYLTDRFSISSGLVRYNNVKTTQLTYKNWGADLNVEITVLKREILNLYGILGLGFQKVSIIPQNTLIDPYNGPDIKSYLFKLNLGIGTQYKIFKNVWVKLDILTNSSYEIIVNPGLLYRFNLGKK